VAVDLEPQVLRATVLRHAAGPHRRQHPGKEFVQDADAAGKKGMRVLSLRHTFAYAPGELVALHNDHLREGLGEHPRRQQTCDASTQHDGVLICVAHRAIPTSCAEMTHDL